MRILGNLFPALSDKRYMLFLVDDNLFVRDFCLDEITRSLQNTPDAMGFSLRLGKNVTHCYTTDLPQSLPEVAGSKNKILKFNWTTAESDFAYPLEVSSSVYRSKDVVPMIAKKPFENPNELEFQMAVSAGTFSEKMPFLLCPEQSLTFCNPLNMVQTSTPNRAGVSVEYNSEHLAAMFDQGYRIDVEKYSGFTPQSCHQEVPLEFYRLESDVVK
ncbi:MAG: hypothetical protein H8E17_19790 [Deltaproteobacteria bacterium]|nr:hypothetical protein [Deltaproteobacteria bacterium]